MIDFNVFEASVGITSATIWLFDYDAIEGSKSEVFRCVISVPKNPRASEWLVSTLGNYDNIASELLPKVNDLFGELMRYSQKVWPLGRWSKTRGYDWHYLSTREEEQFLLQQLALKYYSKPAQHSLRLFQ